MSLISEKQKTKVISNSALDDFELDCFIKKLNGSKIILGQTPNSKNNFDYLEKDSDVTVKIFTPQGIVSFKSNILKIISSNEIEISYNEKNTTIENIRKNPRYETNCPITIFRPLKGNIDTHLIDISVMGLRFYSEIPLEENSEFEIMLYLSDTIGKIILTGKVLNKTGLPEGVHRMLIEKISYNDRQKLVDYCLSLEK